MKILLSGFIFILPELAFAHAGQRGHVMLLPTNLYIGGGAAVVALTFIFMIIVIRYFYFYIFIYFVFTSFLKMVLI